LPALVNPKGRQIKQYFEEMFTKEGGGFFEGLALGIAGDSVSSEEFPRSYASITVSAPHCQSPSHVSFPLDFQSSLAHAAWRVS
jgi:hypothetical protein